MTTNGSTTSCSANRAAAAGSDKRTLVSRTKVRRRGLRRLVLAADPTLVAAGVTVPPGRDRPAAGRYGDATAQMSAVVADTREKTGLPDVQVFDLTGPAEDVMRAVAVDGQLHGTGVPDNDVERLLAVAQVVAVPDDSLGQHVAAGRADLEVRRRPHHVDDEGRRGLVVVPLVSHDRPHRG